MGSFGTTDLRPAFVGRRLEGARIAAPRPFFRIQVTRSEFSFIMITHSAHGPRLWRRSKDGDRQTNAPVDIAKQSVFSGMKNPMRLLLIALAFGTSLAFVPACGVPPPSPTSATANYPDIVPGDPSSIKRWESSQFNAFHSKIEVANLSCFRNRMTEKGHAEAKPVAIHIRGALDSGISPELQAALQQFKNTESELYIKARAAIYAEYRKSYSTYKQAWSLGASLFGGDKTDIEKVLPQIVKGNELDGLISFQTIDLFRAKVGVDRIGIVLDVPWDEENGMGLVIANGQVEQVGDASVVYRQ
jgi:hypothetical protein